MRMTDLRYLMVLLTVFAAGCSDGDGGVSDAEARQLCHDTCDKFAQCGGGDAATCKADCDAAGETTGAQEQCTPAEEREIYNHLKMCVGVACEQLLTCIGGGPSCGGATG